MPRMRAEASSVKNIRSAAARWRDCCTILRRHCFPAIWHSESCGCLFWTTETAIPSFRKLRSPHEHLLSILCILAFVQLLEWSIRITSSEAIPTHRWDDATVRQLRELHHPKLPSLSSPTSNSFVHLHLVHLHLGKYSIKAKAMFAIRRDSARGIHRRVWISVKVVQEHAGAILNPTLN